MRSGPPPLTSQAPAQKVHGAPKTLGLTLGILLSLGGPAGLVPQTLQLLLQAAALTLTVTELLPQGAQEVLAGLIAPTDVLWHGNRSVQGSPRKLPERPPLHSTSPLCSPGPSQERGAKAPH